MNVLWKSNEYFLFFHLFTPFYETFAKTRASCGCCAFLVSTAPKRCLCVCERERERERTWIIIHTLPESHLLGKDCAIEKLHNLQISLLKLNRSLSTSRQSEENLYKGNLHFILNSFLICCLTELCMVVDFVKIKDVSDKKKILEKLCVRYLQRRVESKETL